jgi:hypothetical protein
MLTNVFWNRLCFPVRTGRIHVFEDKGNCILLINVLLEVVFFFPEIGLLNVNLL